MWKDFLVVILFQMFFLMKIAKNTLQGKRLFRRRIWDYKDFLVVILFQMFLFNEISINSYYKEKYYLNI